MPTETQLDALAPYSEVRADIERFKAENAALSFDITTKAGEKAARSHIAKLRTVKGDIDRKRKELKADALEYGRKVDGVAKELTAEVEAMIDVHQKPLDEVERKAAEAAAAIAAEAARVEAEKQAAIQAELDKLRREAAEREAADRKAKEEADRAAREQAAIERALEADRKKAADAAMAEAKRKESEAQAALAAEREKTAKAQREAEKIKREAAEAEARMAREAKARADADAKRAADKAHRVAIFNKITEALVALGVSPALAMHVTVQIADGKVPHTRIEF